MKLIKRFLLWWWKWSALLDLDEAYKVKRAKLLKNALRAGTDPMMDYLDGLFDKKHTTALMELETMYTRAIEYIDGGTIDNENFKHTAKSLIGDFKC